eukprot:5547207-Pleurochrysis_carterae.AAC.1
MAAMPAGGGDGASAALCTAAAESLSTPAVATDAAPGDAAAAAAREGRRRSRWGGKLAEDSAASAPSEAEEGGKKKKTRWGTRNTDVADPVVLAVQLGIPLATLQHMSAEQQQTLPGIKKQMDEIDVLCACPRPNKCRTTQVRMITCCSAAPPPRPALGFLARVHHRTNA